MRKIKEVVQAVANHGGSCTFSYDALGLSLAEFQAVVKLIRDAETRGFLVVHSDHESSRGEGIDSIVVESLTESGLALLKAV